MSISVSDCLKLPAFKDAKVMSGKTELNHPVNNISVLEITNEKQLEYLKDSLNSFEMYLTSFSGIAENVKAQCELIEYFSEKGNVSLVLYYVGSVVRELHKDVILTAEHLSVPLIIMPADRLDLQYCDAVHEVTDLLLNEKKRQEESYRELAVLLSKVPENKRNFAKLLRIVSEMKRVNLLLSDFSYLNTLQSSYFTSEPIDYCTIIDIFNKSCQNQKDHMVISEYEGHKINIFRIKLISHKFRYYYLYILDEADNITFNEAKQITELIQLFSEVWNLSEDEISSQSIINALDEDNLEKLKKLSDKYSLTLDQPGRLFLIHINLEGNNNYNTVHARIQLKEKVKNAAKKTKHFMFFNSYGKYFVLFMNDIRDETANDEFITEISEILCNCRSSITQLQTSLCNIREILQLYDHYFEDMEKILEKQKIYSLSDIFFASTCKRILELKGPDKPLLDSILKKFNDFPDADDLLQTLSTFYLDTNCQINTTAAQLYIHRNTVKYRLKKAHTLLQITTDYSKNKFFMQTLMGYYRLTD